MTKSRPRHHAVCVAALLLSAIFRATVASAATPAQIDQAIAKAKAFLYSRQKQGNWEYVQEKNPSAAAFSENNGQWGGISSVVVYSLLAAGEDPRDEKLKSALEFLKKAKITGVYALGCRCQVWLLLPSTKETQQLARADAEELSRGFNTTGSAKYLYGYLTTHREPNDIDHSVSQFGVLGMWACEQVKPEIVPQSYWGNVERRWVADQQPDGGWLYKGVAFDGGDHMHTGSQASMTAAGVATLFITQDYVHPEASLRCNGNVNNPHIEAGLKWMADHRDLWTPDVVFGDPPSWYPGYTLYGVERIGVASGYKYFGDVDWYQYGADWLIAHQSPSGAWRVDTDVDNTAMCLLFLSRGRAPILINKVSYDDSTTSKPGHWNQRPRDVANFVRWMGRQTERDLNWQITNLKVKDQDLHDAPFLYLAGNETLKLTADEKTRLKHYCQAGGIVLFNADCGSTGGAADNPYVASVVKLGRELFPDYEFRELPPSSPVYSEQFSPKRWKKPPSIRSISNGVREMMILLPEDPGKMWQVQQSTGSGREEMYQSMADIVLYGTDKQPLREKGSGFIVTPDITIKPDRTVKVGRLKYAGNWDPEPGGWPRLAAILHNKAKTDLDVSTVDLSTPVPADIKLLHVTGTDRLKLSDSQQLQLKQYLEHGGTLVIDSAGGSTLFAQDAESLLEHLYPGGLKDPLPAKDPIFSALDPGQAIRYRSFARSMLGNLNTSRLKAVNVNGRNVVYYSREDISAGLVGQSVDGIVGYDPDSATAIMAGIVLETK